MQFKAVGDIISLILITRRNYYNEYSLKDKTCLYFVLADIVWGIAFVAQSKGGDAVGAFSFNGIRFLIGALCLLPVIKILDKKELTVNRPESKKQKKELWIAGSCCGIALFLRATCSSLESAWAQNPARLAFLQLHIYLWCLY